MCKKKFSAAVFLFFLILGMRSSQLSASCCKAAPETLNKVEILRKNWWRSNDLDGANKKMIRLIKQDKCLPTLLSRFGVENLSSDLIDPSNSHESAKEVIKYFLSQD